MAGSMVAAGEVGEAGAAVGFDPLVFGMVAVTGRPDGILQAERTRIDTSNKERSRILISLL